MEFAGSSTSTFDEKAKERRREREKGECCLQNTRFDVLVSMDLCTEKRGLCVSVWILKERKEGRRTREKKHRENVAGRLLNGRFICFCAYATHVCLCACLCVRICMYNLSSWRTTTLPMKDDGERRLFSPSFSFRPPACHWLKSLFRRQQHLVYW